MLCGTAQPSALPCKPKIKLPSRGGGGVPAQQSPVTTMVNCTVGRQPSPTPQQTHQSQRGMSPLSKKRLSSDSNSGLARWVYSESVITLLSASYKRLLYTVGFLWPTATTFGWTTFPTGYCQSQIQYGVQDDNVTTGIVQLVDHGLHGWVRSCGTPDSLLLTHGLSPTTGQHDWRAVQPTAGYAQHWL